MSLRQFVRPVRFSGPADHLSRPEARRRRGLPMAAGLIGFVAGFPLRGAAQAERDVGFSVAGGIGYQVPAMGLGTLGVAEGRRGSAPVLSVALEYRPPTTWIGFRASIVEALTARLEATPTPNCVGSCTRRSFDRGRFRGFGLDVTARRRMGVGWIGVSAGPWLRSYRSFSGLNVCETDRYCLSTVALLMTDTRPAAHLGLEAAVHLGRRQMARFSISDVVSGYRTGRTLHDLQFGIEFGVRL